MRQFAFVWGIFFFFLIPSFSVTTVTSQSPSEASCLCCLTGAALALVALAVRGRAAELAVRDAGGGHHRGAQAGRAPVWGPPPQGCPRARRGRLLHVLPGLTPSPSPANQANPVLWAGPDWGCWSSQQLAVGASGDTAEGPQAGLWVIKFLLRDCRVVTRPEKTGEDLNLDF